MDTSLPPRLASSIRGTICPTRGTSASIRCPRRGGNRIAGCLLGGAFLFALLGCPGDPSGPALGDVEVSEAFSFNVDAGAVDALTLEGVNGEVRIVGDPARTMARIEGRRRVRSDSRSDAQAFLDQVTVEVLEEGDTLEVRTRQPSRSGGRQVVVDYEVAVPAALAIRIASINGDLSVEGIESSVAVTHVNGWISLAGLVGNAEAALVNGGISADVSPPAGGLIDLRTVNGEITLDVPASVSALLAATVVNGTVSVQGLTITDAETSPRSVSGTLGGGNGLIELALVNGTITLRGL